jgi:hypothetical protein
MVIWGNIVGFPVMLHLPAGRLGVLAGGSVVGLGSLRLKHHSFTVHIFIELHH